MNQNNIRNLVVCRAGDTSLHPLWLHPPEDKNFDVWINYFGTQPGKYVNDCLIYKESGGTKFPELYDLINENLEQILTYDTVWLPDDDIVTDVAAINQMFQIFNEHELWLAQPSLHPNSYYSYSITLKNDGCSMRCTNFVESMVPVFATKILLKLLHTFKESVSGWGLDFIWPKLLGNPRDKVGIIDSVAVFHSRPAGAGELYQQTRKPANDEMVNLTAKYKISLPYPMVTYQFL
jgi:hypothetical protein